MNVCLDRIGQPMRHFSYGAGPLTIIHSVNIEDECPNSRSFDQQILLDFGQGTEGVVFEISIPHEGSELSLPMDALDNIYSVKMSIFCECAKMFGLRPEELTLLIQREAPPVNREKLWADIKQYSQAPDSRFEFCLKKAGLTTADLIQ